MTPPLPQEDLAEIARQPFWSGLQQATVLFTGGSGFFGSWLLESFLFASDQWGLNGRAIVLTRKARGFADRLPHLAAHPGVILLEGDARNFSPRADGIDVIIHSLVPDTGTSLSASADFFKQATCHLLSLARKFSCQHFLLCSTGAVYQPVEPPHAFLETSPRVSRGGPLTYSHIRCMVEDLCLQAASEENLPVRVARGFAFVGPRLPLNATFAMGNFLRDGLSGRPIRVQGDGTAIRSYLYTADMAVWLWTLLLRGKAGEICNVGSKEAISIAGLAQRIAERFGGESHVLGRPFDGAAPAHYLPDIQFARSHFGLEVTNNLDDSLEKTIRWNRKLS